MKDYPMTAEGTAAMGADMLRKALAEEDASSEDLARWNDRNNAIPREERVARRAAAFAARAVTAEDAEDAYQASIKP